MATDVDELLDSLPQHLRTKVLKTLEPDEKPARVNHHRVRRACRFILRVTAIVLLCTGRALIWTGTKLQTFLQGKSDSNRLTS